MSSREIVPIYQLLQKATRDEKTKLSSAVLEVLEIMTQGTRTVEATNAN